MGDQHGWSSGARRSEGQTQAAFAGQPDLRSHWPGCLSLACTLLLAFFLVSAAPTAAGHDYELDAGDEGFLLWRTTGNATWLYEHYGPEPSNGTFLLVAGDPGEGAWIRITTVDGQLVHQEGVGAHAKSVRHGALSLVIDWRPDLPTETCVLVAADVRIGARTILDMPVAHESPDALWRAGAACHERLAHVWGPSSCGHPDIPAYCTPGMSTLPVLGALLGVVGLRRVL